MFMPHCLQHCINIYMMLCTTLHQCLYDAMYEIAPYDAMYHIVLVFFWCYVWHCTSVYMILCTTLCQSLHDAVCDIASLFIWCCSITVGLLGLFQYFVGFICIENESYMNFLYKVWNVCICVCKYLEKWSLDLLCLDIQ